MADDILDLDEFMERVQEDKELLAELLDIFINDFQEKSKQLREAVANNDAEQLKSISHSLKGASGNISAKKLREIFVKLEEFGKENKAGEAGELLDAMDEQFKALSERIDSVKKDLG